MILVGIQVDCVDSSWALLEVIQDVISRACDCKDNVVSLDVQQLVIHAGIFPGKCVDVLVLELRVFREEVVVEDPAGVILIEGRWKGEIRAEVHNGRFIRFGSDIARALLDCFRHFHLVVGRRQVR